MKLRCPVCRGTFRWNPSDRWPDYCQIESCEAFIGSDEKNEVAAPYIALKGGAHARAVDQVYRDAERASEARIDAAVAMTPGASREDFSVLKITDYKANMTEGEAAVPMPQPSREFTQNVAALQNAGIPVHNGGIDISGQIPAFSAQTRSGPFPNAGAQAMDRLRGAHRGNVDPRMNTPISSLPALETQAPGYVPRSQPIVPGVGK